MADFTYDNQGRQLLLDACDLSYTYTASGSVQTITAVSGSDTWIRTYNYDGSGRLLNRSKWVKQ